MLFDWAFPAAIRAQLRVAWDRAAARGRWLRLRLSIDAPELAAWPWELLHDTERDYTFATSASTPLVRFYDQTDRFGALADAGTELPIELLLVLPTARGSRSRPRATQRRASGRGDRRRAARANARRRGDPVRPGRRAAARRTTSACTSAATAALSTAEGYLGLNEPDGGGRLAGRRRACPAGGQLPVDPARRAQRLRQRADG